MKSVSHSSIPVRMNPFLRQEPGRNVQGDERDVIFISVAYGSDADGDGAAELRPTQQRRRRKTPQCANQ